MKRKTNFRGLEVADMDFSRTKEKCSKLIKESCGTRDCSLEVCKLGNDFIYSGGLCPKGNTSFNSKKAPDYVLIYNNILAEHLKKITKPLEESTPGKRVLIPRSMIFLNEKGVFYSSVYHNLGFDISLSPESDEEISNLGKSFSHSEFCYPLILAHGHAAFLKEKMKEGDKLLLVDAISEGNEKYKFCPYVASSGNVIAGNLDLDTKDVLIPVMHFNDKDYPIHKSIHKDLNRVFPKKFSEKQVSEAVEKAKKDEKAFLNEVFRKGEEILNSLKEKREKAFIAIGRGYTIFDPKANSRVNELFVANGLHFIPSYFIDTKDCDADSIVENMYWYQGRKMIEKTFFSFREKNFFPVRLTNFNCGPDSILHYHEEKLAKDFDKPWLVLETDGHNSNAQFGTRILAHNRVIDKYLKNPDKSNFQPPSKPNQDFYGKIIGVPYMGDGSDILAAALRAVGLNVEVMPTRTKESIEISKKIVNTNTCRPFSFQIGDNIAWIESYKKKGTDPNKLAVFMLTTKGPCRFGQYYVVLKKFFEERGFDIAIMNPNSANDYNDINIPAMKRLLVICLFFKCSLAHEILKSCLLRSRPYEIHKGESEKVYNKAHQELVKLTETNPSLKKLSEFMEDKLKEFEKIEKNDSKRFPLVLMNGEIFLRSHELSNDNSIKLLESNKLEIILDPIYTWVNYINKNSIQKSIQRNNFSLLGVSLIKRAYMKKIAGKLFLPFVKFLEGREFHDVYHLIQNVEKNLVYNSAIEGESAVSIGTAYSFVKGELPVDGIYHVGPLGCMQETIATSRTQSLINQKKNSANNPIVIPFMDAVFGDTPIPNLDSQIAIFAENCWLKKEMRASHKNFPHLLPK